DGAGTGEDDDSADASTQDDGLQANERSLSADIAIEKARKSAKDVLLDEAAHILGDEADLLAGIPKLAVQQPASTNGK
ncbi:hypothetical protein KC220_23490, partial [Mycobacterium tuberculosis]|nr:hypothetical protein [Mycobacterium tuberculosis]